MSPEVQTYIETANLRLSDAQSILQSGFPRVAAREAYLASFSAAQALILAMTGKIGKTHSGVRSQFAQLTRGSTHIAPGAARYLAGGYQQKTVADYGDAFLRTPITREIAADSLDRARALIDQVTRAISALADPE